MSGALCQRAGCHEVSNEPRPPKCSKADCPGRETLMPFVHVWAPDACQHQWDGPYVDIENGTSITCSKCGMDAFSYSLRTGL